MPVVIKKREVAPHPLPTSEQAAVAAPSASPEAVVLGGPFVVGNPEALQAAVDQGSAIPICLHAKERLDAENKQYKLWTCLQCGRKRYDPPEAENQQQLPQLIAPSSDPLPWEHEKAEQTILDAIYEFSEGKKKGKLFLLNKTSGQTYEVKGWDADERRALLHGYQGKHKMVLKPRITEREVPLYEFYWR